MLLAAGCGVLLEHHAFVVVELDGGCLRASAWGGSRCLKPAQSAGASQVSLIGPAGAAASPVAGSDVQERKTRSLNDSVLYKLFLDKWDGKTKVVPPIRGGSTPPVIVGQ